jgi:ABC-type branched-subunit amino acid transport system substrate-binding protein
MIFVGTTHLAGLEAAAAYYNAQGGIDGHKIVIHHFSDNGDSTTAVSVLLQQLSSGATPTMIDAGSEAGDAGALIPVIARHDVFAMALNDGANQCLTDASTKCPNEFTLADASNLPQVAVANWMHSKGYTKAGIMQEAILFTQHETPYFLAAAKPLGITSSTASFPATALDITPELSQLKGANPQVLFTEVLAAPSGYAITGRAKLGWNVPMVFDVAGSSLDLTTLAPPAEVKKQVYEDIFYEMDPSDPSAGIKNMLQYSKPYGNIAVVPLDVASTGFDEVVALNAAVHADGGSLAVKDLDAGMLKIPPTDPNRTFSRELGYTANNHENVLGKADDFEIVPAGPVINGQVHSY